MDQEENPVPKSDSAQDIQDASPDSEHDGNHGYHDSPLPDHNPEAPPELLDREDLISADKIGDTVFSKHWLFTTLMKLIQVVDGQCEGKEEPAASVDLDDNLQDELCKLWDMSMNSEVVSFLQEFKAVDILTGVIAKSQAPRATEICVGILGNMACNDDACNKMAASSKLKELIVLLLPDPDTPTLVETMRLLLTVISNSTHRKAWIDVIKSKEEFLSYFTFILSSSTNADLLRNAAMFLDKLLDVEEELCSSWATNEFVDSLLEAAKQIGCRPGEALDAVLHVLQLLSTTEQGVTALVKRGEELCRLMLQYLLLLCSEEILGVEGHENSFSSTFSTLNVIIVSSPEASKIIFQDYELVRCLLKVLDVVYVKLHPECRHEHRSAQRRRSRTRSRYRSMSTSQSSPPKDNSDTHKPVTSEAQEETTSLPDASPKKQEETASSSDKNQMSQSQSEAGDKEKTGNDVTQKDEVTESQDKEAEVEEEDYDVTRLRVLYDVLQILTQDVVAMLASQERVEVARSLLYLETGCSRDRLYAMVWTLVDETGTTNSTDVPQESAPMKGLRQVVALKDLAKKHKLRRLEGILDDALDLNPTTRGL